MKNNFKKLLETETKLAESKSINVKKIISDLTKILKAIDMEYERAPEEGKEMLQGAFHRIEVAKQHLENYDKGYFR